MGLGYVQGADGATDIRATGSAAGFRIDFRSLTTTSARRTLLDQGLLVVSTPGGGASAEVGDVFSLLAGVGRGARVSWASWRGRRPAILISTAHRLLEQRPVMATYRDQWRLWGDSVVEGEIASDGSHLIGARATTERWSLDASDRRRRHPSSRDRALGASLTVWRNLRVRGSVSTSSRDGQRSLWRTVGISVPIGKIDVSVERTFSNDGPMRNTMSSVMAGTSVGQMRFFHRQQWGTVDYRGDDLVFLQQMRHLQSMATYGVGARVHLTLQLASQWMPSGGISTWEELHSTVRATRSTNLELAVAVPRIVARDRLRARVTQELPRRFALELEYGRVAPYQITTIVDSRPRMRAMLVYRFDVQTPPGRATVRGAVVDHAGRPVPRAVVRLGPYAVPSDDEGQYRFNNVPAGQFDLSLDEAQLSADHTWDGQRLRINTAQRSTGVVLRVAPLATITGRVFVDRNRDGVCDTDEALAGVVVALDDQRATATDSHGNYGFYNLPPGAYTVRIARRSLAADLEPSVGAQTVDLAADRPVAGLNFLLRSVERAVVWSDLR